MTLGELAATAGWSMVPILLCSVVASAVFVFKLLQLHRAQLSRWGWLEPVLVAVEARDLDAALRACGSANHAGARVLQAALRALATRPSRATAEAQRVGGLELQALESQLDLLAFIAQTAPLLGLLGTVLGMVDLFAGLEGAGLRDVDVGLLSAGIWKALLTTAAGLAVAVPTLAAHAYLARRADDFRLRVQDAVERLLTAGTEPEAP